MSFQGNTSVIWQASPLLQPKMISQRCIDGRLGFCLPPLDAVFPCKTEPDGILFSKLSSNFLSVSPGTERFTIVDPSPPLECI